MSDLELVERDAFATIFAAAPAELGIQTVRVGGAVCTAVAGGEWTMLNRAWGVGVEEPATDEQLDEIDAFFTRLRVPYALAVAPDARPADLSSRLLTRGLARDYAWMKFRRDVLSAPEAETDLRVEEVPADRGSDVGRVLLEVYGMPDALRPWWDGVVGAPDFHWFVAYAGAEPAAAGGLYVRGRTGWLGGAGTRDAFRRRGGQSAILAARVDAARALGVEQLVTETGERLPGRPDASYRNILRAGFEEAYLRPNYAAAASASA